MMSGGMSGMGKGSQEIHRKMMRKAKSMQDMPTSNDVDKDFAMMMRAHDLQAVEMAQAQVQVQVQNGQSPELKKMAQKIIADQKKEIGQFDKWLATHKCTAAWLSFDDLPGPASRAGSASCKLIPGSRPSTTQAAAHGWGLVARTGVPRR